MNPNGQQRSCSDQIAEWWASLPLINKGLISGTTLLFILNIFMRNFFYYGMVDVPLLTLGHFQLWRVVTAFMIHADIFQLLFCLISLVGDSVRLEKILGSAAFLFDIILKNIQVQIIYLLIMYLLHFSNENFMMMPSSGLWDLVMVFITIRSASNPEQPTQFLCLPIVIKSKYYPFFIILLFSVMSGAPFSLIAAMIVGYIEACFFNGMMLRLSREKAIWLENKVLKCLLARPDFLSATNLDSPYFMNMPNPAPNNQANSGYMGGRGVQIGGGNDNVARPPPVPRVAAPPPRQTSQEQAKAKTGGGAGGTAPFTGKGRPIGMAASNNNENNELYDERDDSEEAIAGEPKKKNSDDVIGKNNYKGLVEEKEPDDAIGKNNYREDKGKKDEKRDIDNLI